ncbi:MAG TPA: hypothetical protein VKZ41_06790 [Gemmatimonadales bacterium]|nr:hypothetical protein [Gemmatimonadales bacterium]
MNKPTRLTITALAATLLAACSTGDIQPAGSSGADSPDSALAGSAPALLDAAPGTGMPDTMSVTNVADLVVAAVDELRWSDLAALAHPTHGIRFAPYGHIDTSDTQRLMPEEIAALGNDVMVRHWGTADGTGDPLDFTFAEYYTRFLYLHDFNGAEKGAPNEIVESGNSLVNLREAFPMENTTFVEYYVPGTEQYGGMDWASLRVVLLHENDRVWVIGLVNDRWTI